VITFEKNGARFVYRVSGVALTGDRVLLHQAARDVYWSLPGGRCEIGEPSRETLGREMREELGVEVEVGRLLWVVENFFVHFGVPYHELGLYYSMTFPGDCFLYRGRGPFRGDEEGLELIFKWFGLEELDGSGLLPTFLRQSLRSLPETTEHIVHWDQVQ
jgi:ADP-ribose pyrophosphatase YjhB (NUDIX family)